MHTFSFEGTIESFVQLARSSGVAIACIVSFWGADKLISDDGRAAIWQSMKENIVDRNLSILIFDKYFGYSDSAGVFFKRIGVLSVTSMLIMLIGFSYVVPPFRHEFIDNPEARLLFLRGILTEGLLPILAVNWAAVIAERKLRRSKAFLLLGPPLILAADIVLRIFIFAAALTIVYVYSSDFFGSFGGSNTAALGSVSTTLNDAVVFQNTTGAYLYAAAIPGLPLFVATVIDMMQRSPFFGKIVGGLFFFLPFHKQPIRSSAFVVGVFFGMFSLIARLLIAVAG